MRIFALTALIVPLLLLGCSKTEQPSTDTETATPAVLSQAQAATPPADVQPQIAPVETETSEAPVASQAADPHAGHNHEQQAAEPEPELASSEATVAGATPSFIEGKHYEKLPVAVKTVTGSKIEVTEIFSYSCGHCFRFEGPAKAWKANMPEGVEFVQTHAAFNPNWAHYARIFYTAKSLGVLDKVHENVFRSVHVQGNRLANKKDIAALFKEAGVDEATFNETFDSFGVNTQVDMADARVRSFQTNATPELIVDGRYRITTSLAGNYTNMFEIVNFLVDKIKSEK